MHRDIRYFWHLCVTAAFVIGSVSKYRFLEIEQMCCFFFLPKDIPKNPSGARTELAVVMPGNDISLLLEGRM